MAERGAYTSILIYASDIESDVLVGARLWTSREWTATCDVEPAELDAAIGRGFVWWEGDDLRVDAFDHAGLKAVKAKRAAGRHGKEGGQPKKPSGFPNENPMGSDSETPSPPLSSPPPSLPYLPGSDCSGFPGQNAEPVATFPTAGTPKSWSLTRHQVGKWTALYPGVDVEQECRGALAWVEANPKKKKTAGGMSTFLVGWLSRSQNRTHVNGATNGRNTDVRVGSARAEDNRHVRSGREEMGRPVRDQTIGYAAPPPAGTLYPSGSVNLRGAAEGPK